MLIDTRRTRTRRKAHCDFPNLISLEIAELDQKVHRWHANRILGT